MNKNREPQQKKSPQNGRSKPVQAQTKAPTNSAMAGALANAFNKAKK